MEYNIEMNLKGRSVKVWIGLNQFKRGSGGGFIDLDHLGNFDILK